MFKFKGYDTKKKIFYSAEELSKDQLTLMPDGSGFINVSGNDTRNSILYTHIIPVLISEVQDIEKNFISLGDLVTIPSIENYPIGEVKFGFHHDDSEYGWYVRGSNGRDAELNKTWEIGQIVGNVYQNPEKKVK